MPPTRWRRPDVPGASSCRRACALSGRAPEKVGWLYSIGHLVRTGGFSVFLTSAHAGVENFERELQVARADRVGRATGGSSPSPSGPRLKALKSISFNMGLKRSYSPIFVTRRKVIFEWETVRVVYRLVAGFRALDRATTVFDSHLIPRVPPARATPARPSWRR